MKVVREYLKYSISYKSLSGKYYIPSEMSKSPKKSKNTKVERIFHSDQGWAYQKINIHQD